MKEDILEQLIEDWYVSRPGWFVKHNVKYRPNNSHIDYESKKDSVNSDIDVIAYSAIEGNTEKVHVISCKSWQNGINLKSLLRIIESEAVYNPIERDHFQRREEWKSFREIVSDKWIQAFINKVYEETGQKDFTYIIAATKVIGNREEKERIENINLVKTKFSRYGSNIILKIIDLKQVIDETLTRIRNKETPAVEMTEIGRVFQLLNAANIKIDTN